MNDPFDTRHLTDRELLHTFFETPNEAKKFLMSKLKELEPKVQIGAAWAQKRIDAISKEKDEMISATRFAAFTTLNKTYQEFKRYVSEFERIKRLYETCDKAFISKKSLEYEKDINAEKIEYASNYPIRRLIERFCEPRKDTCICPLHQETMPSLHIYDSTNSFYCFGCKNGGSPIDFIMKLRGYNFREAVGFINNL